MNDISVTIDGNTVTLADACDSITAENGDAITLKFKNDWIKTQVGNTITITYTATINQNALTIDNAKNTASLDYGNNTETNSTEVEPPVIHTAKITVTKVDNKNQPLAGAGFILKNADGKYYNKANDTGSITWVDNIDNATELTTTDAENGNVVVFDGLGAGTYTLEEKTVPDGYNKAENDTNMTVTIANTDLTENIGTVEKPVTVTNNAGAVLPSTGGIGTTIFYVLGGVLIVAAVVLLVTRKRMREE